VTGIDAQAPQKIDYQAIARESDGQPIAEQNIGVQISILRGPLPGTMVYQERHNTTTDRFGLFTFGIGTGSVQSGAFPGIDWAAGSHFVQIELDKNGGTSWVDMGTVELMSTPYALYAERSGTSEKPDHEWADTYLRFENPDGSWGSYVDLQGEQGPEGPAGQDGTGVNIIGSVPSAAHLDPFYSGEVGDMFIAENTGAGHVWNGSEWIEVGQIQGPEGPQGEPGEQGEQGPTGPPGTTSWTGLNNIPAGFADNIDNVDDADASTINEKIISLSLNASNILSVSEPGNTKTVDLSSLAGGSNLWTQNGDNIYYNNGKVGIGTANPSQKLEVKNGIIKSSGSLSSGFYAQGNANEGFWSYDNPGHGIRAHMNGGYGIYSDENDDGAAYFDGDVHIVGNSKVGIGTLTPSATLAVGANGVPGDAIHGETSGASKAGVYGRSTGTDGYGGIFSCTNTNGTGIAVVGEKYDIHAQSPGGESLFEGNVIVEGEVQSDNTGSANLVPFAYGRISSYGNIEVTTGNVTAQKTGTGVYEILVTSLGGSSGYIVQTTSNNSSCNIAVNPGTGGFDVYSRNVNSGDYADAGFYFIVYKK
jgi:hypothetical protein